MKRIRARKPEIYWGLRLGTRARSLLPGSRRSQTGGSGESDGSAWEWRLDVYRIRETRCGIGNGLVMREPTVHERQDRMGRDKMRE
jgi:hypothetical protein